MDMVGGEEGEREMYGESNIEIYNTLCETDGQWEFTVSFRELKRALWQAEGWGGKGDGSVVWEGGDMDLPMADSWCMTEKPQSFVKQLSFS